jgi:hypothetical protein
MEMSLNLSGKSRVEVKQNDIITTPRKNAVSNIFTEILDIKPQSLAAVSSFGMEKL